MIPAKEPTPGIGRAASFDASTPPLMIGVGEAAALIGLGRSTTWSLVRRGDLRSIRASERRILIAKTEVLRYIEHGSALG